MKIPANNLKRSFELYQEELEQKALEILRSGWYILGKEVESFEKEFAEAIGSKYCVGVGNGLDAIKLGIQALGIGPGDNVLVQANTYIATVLGVTLNGALPIFVEPTPYYNIDPKLIEENLTECTKAVLVTHLYGQASEMDEIAALCREKNLVLLEDCAQSHFAAYNGKNTGTFGKIGFFSFYPTKTLGALGDAGAVVTDDLEVAEKIKKMRNYGSIKKYQNEIEGYNSRLDEIQAGFLRVKLKHVKDSINEREKIAHTYLQGIKNQSITLPGIAEKATHVWHQFVVEVENRKKFREFLSNQEIATDIHYPVPPHLSKAYQRLGYHKGSFPYTEKIAERIVSLPIYNGMTDKEIEKVIKTINDYKEA